MSCAFLSKWCWLVIPRLCIKNSSKTSLIFWDESEMKDCLSLASNQFKSPLLRTCLQPGKPLVGVVAAKFILTSAIVVHRHQRNLPLQGRSVVNPALQKIASSATIMQQGMLQPWIDFHMTLKSYKKPITFWLVPQLNCSPSFRLIWIHPNLRKDMISVTLSMLLKVILTKEITTSSTWSPTLFYLDCH